MKSLSTRFLMPFGLLAILVSVLMFYATYEASRRHAYQLLGQQAALALEFNLAIREYAADRIRPVMAKLVDYDDFLPETMSTSFIARQIFEEARKKFPDLIVRFPSDNPRNPLNLANAEELRMIEYFRQNSSVPWRSQELQIDGRLYLAHFTSKWLKPECMRCHGDPKDAPAELVKRYGATASFHRMVGDVAGLDMVAVPLETVNTALADEMRSQSMLLAAALVLLFGSILVVFRFTVTRRLVAMAGHFDAIATHAQSSSMTPVEVKGNDEITIVGRAFNKLIEQLGAAQASLELRVSERTEEWRKVNEQLQWELAERQRVNDALREGEERYRLIFNHAPLGILHFDRKGVVLDCNDRFAEIIGAPRDRVLGFEMLERLRDADFLQAVKNALAGEVGYYEGDYVSVIGGKTTPLRAIYKHMTADDGRFLGAVGLFEDITERRQAEQALRDSEARYRFLVEHMREGLAMGDADFILQYVNPMMSEILGYGREELLGQALADFLKEESRSVLSEVQHRRKQGMADRYELTFTRKDGAPAYTLVSAHPLHDPQGVFCGTIGVFTDITDRKKTEEALARTEEKYRSIFENAIEGIFQTTLEGRLFSANPALAQILGYDSPEDATRSVTDLSREYVNPERRSELLREIEKYGRVDGFETQFFRKDRSIVWVSFNIYAVRDSGGAILHLEGTLQDISDRKALESRLIQAQKMEAIGTLAGGIAHDFNNILAAIIGYAEIIKVKFNQPGLHNYLERILDSSGRARDLVAQILTFSRGSEQERKRIDMASLVNEAFKMLRAVLPATITFRQTIASGIHAILADPTQIHQVLVNLGTNAAYAMREGGGVLDVSLENVELSQQATPVSVELSPGSYVKLMVRDTGKGIAPEVMHRIFDPFFTTKKTGEGTGLGLSVVYGIVNGCGGAIVADSEPGVGSVFTVYLPATTHGPELQLESAESVPGGTERILFVDDEDTLVDMWRQLLEDLGYRTLATTDSMEALEWFRKGPDQFDLVVTDMTMPGMTGVELAGEMLRIRPDIPIILCTGFSESITEEKAKAMGIREFAMKPLNLQSLAQLMRKALKQDLLA